MADKHTRFADLAASEPEGTYAITARDLGTSVVVVAPHGGGIEPGTSEIAQAIAGDIFSYYLFEGRKKSSNKRDLHITSVNFDEPRCLSLIRSARLAVTVHGEESSGQEVVFIGGLHYVAIEAVRLELESAGFAVLEHPRVALRGRDPRNICNVGSSGAGVQLELTRALRSSFFQSLKPRGREVRTPRLAHFVGSVNKALLATGL